MCGLQKAVFYIEAYLEIGQYVISFFSLFTYLVRLQKLWSFNEDITIIEACWPLRHTTAQLRTYYRWQGYKVRGPGPSVQRSVDMY